MKLIAHRANLYGPSPLENMPAYIVAALNRGFDAEIDVWYVDGFFCLGHDKPTYTIDSVFLRQRGLWCHAKNPAAFDELLQMGVHCFWHDKDTYTVTSKGVVWTFPNAPLVPNAIWNQPEWTDVFDLFTISKTELNKWAGVCSDYVAVLDAINKNELIDEDTASG